MDAISDPGVERVVVMAAAQTGKTEVLLNVIGFHVDRDPAPMLLIQPTVEIAQAFSKDRVVPMVRDTPCLNGKVADEKSRNSESTILSKRFVGGHLTMVGANSAAGLAMRPIRIVLADEVDRYPATAGHEGNPLALAWKRATTYWNRKLLETSTPTDRGVSQIERDYDEGTREEWCLLCPECDERQPLEWKRLQFAEVGMACRACGVISPEMAWKGRAGRWVAQCPEALLEKRTRSFHLTALASPWLSWRDMIAEFREAHRQGPELLRVFWNTRLGLPWVNAKSETTADLVLERQTAIPEGIVPADAVLLTGGVDVQRGSLYWTLRAWGPRMTSWNVAHGQALGWSEVEAVMNRPYPREDGGAQIVNLVAVDSGDGMTMDEVYQWVAIHQDWAVPVKGSSHQMMARYRISTVDRPTSQAHGLRLVTVDTDAYKAMISGRLHRENGPGAWMVHADCDREYAEQVTAEHRVRKPRAGREVETWEVKAAGADNHYLDAEVYAAVAADLMQVRYLDDGVQPAAPVAPRAAARTDQPGGWLGGREGKAWL
jgi:phage terminase large subunit GpA-like protein